MIFGSYFRRTAGVVAVALALVSGAASLYRMEARRQREHVRAELDVVARLKVAELARWRADRERDAREIAGRPGHADRLRNVIERGDAADADHLVQDFGTLSASGSYVDVAVVDGGGHVRAALHAPPGSRMPVEDALRASLAAGAPVTTDIYRLPGADAALRIGIVLALERASPADARHTFVAPSGGLVLVCDPEATIYPLIRAFPSDVRTAEAVLARRDGSDALVLSPLRRDPDAALRLRVPLADATLPVVRAALGAEGPVDGPDVRGTPVFAMARRVPGSPWFLIAKIDGAEARAPLRVHLALTALVVIAALGTLSGALVLRWQRREKEHYRQLYRAELAQRVSDVRQRELFEHSPVAYQSLDEQGLILDVNEEWSALLGYRGAELLGKSFGDLWSGPTQDRFPGTFERFKRDGEVRGELELVRKDGTLLRVLLTGRVQRDADGRFVRTHCIFTDITARATAEEALREQVRLREQLAQTAAAAPGLIYSFRVRPDGGVSLPYVTEAARDLFGVEPDLLAREGAPVFDLMHPEDAPRIRATIERSAADLAPWQGCWRHRHPVKGERWIEARSTPQREPDGSVVWHGFAMDVTGQRAAESVKAEHEMLRTALLDDSNDGIAIFDADYRLIQANRRFTEMLGYSPGEMLELRTWDIDANLDEAQVRAAFTDPADARRTFETRHRRKDGSVYDVEVSTSGAVVDGQARFIAICRDITARKRAEAALREHDDRMRRMGEMARIGAWEHRADGGWFWDDEIARIHDVDPGSVRDRSEFVRPYPEATRVALEEARRAAVEAGQSYDLEVEIATVAGRRKWIRTMGIPVVEQGRVVKVRGALQDITPRKQAEAERERLQQQLLHAQKMESVGRLAGGIAHDFNNMLGVILGHAALALEDVPAGTALRASLDEIQSAAQRSAELTRQLLAFARRQTAAPRVLDLNATIAGMLNMLRRLIGEDIDLAWLPAAGAWPVNMDPVQIDQLLANLCINARDAITGVGHITLETANVELDAESVAAHPGWAPGPYVRLSVSDDGCGMDDAVLERLFEPFFTTKPTGKGTGLGLATVYGIVKQNDGYITVCSEKGQGTTFHIYIPRSGRLVADEPERAWPAIPAARGETVLLVEDEAAILRLEEQMLRRLGYEVLPAGTPRDALRVAAGHTGRIDLVMTDVVMPGMNGRELAETIAIARPGIRCLYMSGYTADVIAHRGVLDDGVNFLQKPFSLRDLALRVRGALEGGELATTSAPRVESP